MDAMTTTATSALAAWADCLACPDCEHDLRLEPTTLSCAACGYSTAVAAPLDLRPRAPRPRTLTARVFSSGPTIVDGCTLGPPPRVYAGPPAQRDSSTLFSAVHDRCRPGARILDVGCGPRDQAVPAEHLGLRYVGVDIDSRRADFLADAHALPFRAATFDLVIAYAVLEHLAQPFVATAAVARVLTPGGVFFGAVSQGEPFHASYFHHTAWGLAEVLAASGFELARLWPSYDTLRALATMGRYPRVWRWVLATVSAAMARTSFLAPRRHFRWTPRERALDEIYRAASLCFVAVKRG